MPIQLNAPAATIYKGDDAQIDIELAIGGVPWPIPATPDIEIRFRPATGSTPITATTTDSEVVVTDAPRGRLVATLSDVKTALLVAGASLPIVAVVTKSGDTKTFELSAALTVKDRALGV